MAIEPIISWNAPSHISMEKTGDWYWGVGIITLTIAVLCFIFGNVIPGIFVIVAAVALVLHSYHPVHNIVCSINDRGIIVDDTLYSFLDLDSFWIEHDMYPSKILIKSRKVLMPLIVIRTGDADPEELRQVLLKYIAETQHREPLLKMIMERLGF